MYTKNPVTGLNETIVNTSMLRGAISGVTTKISSKADKGALEELSVYAEHVADSVADKADKSAVAAVSAYAEGMLPKDVYSTMVDAYVGLACKVADPDVLEEAAKVAYAANPVKYATSNPSDDRCAEVTLYNYNTGNPIYDAVNREVEKAQGGDITVSLPPFLRLTSFVCITNHPVVDPSVRGKLKTWTTGLPNLTNGTYMFEYTSLTSFTAELPNLTNGTHMFDSTGLTSWTVELPNLTNGTHMFDSTGLTSWTVELPNLTNGSWMFGNTSLTSFTAELPNLTNGNGMFVSTGLTSWTVQLPNITNGEAMFYGVGLTSFSPSLPNLTNGLNMFDGCQLDIDSLRRIAEGINDVRNISVGVHAISIGLSTEAFNHPDKETYKDLLNAKGWTVTF